ncbi:hypothetical protein VTP01DRAFT_5005 [Rhizomucor pusillus]|uniref:uncharacterized protein n=1 Tax=Rhizomucor pusillus TaxID=4840 RepID=UPI0037440212
MTTESRPGFAGSLLQIMAPELPLILFLIFGGCCSNVFALEVIVKDVPKSGHLVTFAQFVFVALEGLRHHIQWGRYGPCLKPTAVPISRWMLMVTLFFFVSVLNNIALGYRISVPLHIIFRSGGLFTNMVMGAIILKKRYPLGQIVGVGLVTLGVAWATLDNANVSNDNSDEASVSEFLVGITLLVIAMILSAGLGLLQEVTYKKYGKEWREGLFYTHFLALPFFLLFYKDLAENAAIYSASPAAPLPKLLEQVPVLGTSINHLLPSSIQAALDTIVVPKLWGFLILNVLTQYVCIAGVNRMTAAASSLTLNLVLNLRKFTSLLISIIYFDNEFGDGAKMGTALVIMGTVVYSQAGMKQSSASAPSSNNAVQNKDK